jgi:hypothetical protein
MPDVVTREAYSHEVPGSGLRLGSRQAPNSMFYAYAYPTPDGFSEADVQPEEVQKDAAWCEWTLAALELTDN